MDKDLDSKFVLRWPHLYTEGRKAALDLQHLIAKSTVISVLLIGGVVGEENVGNAASSHFKSSSSAHNQTSSCSLIRRMQPLHFKYHNWT